MTVDNSGRRLHGRVQDNPNFNVNAVTSWKASEWEHLTLVVNGATQRLTIYNKGAYKNATNMSTPGDLSEGMMIGNDAELNSDGMDGKMDEIRFSPQMRSAEWVRYSYENQKADADIFDFGPLQGPPTSVMWLIWKEGNLMSFTHRCLVRSKVAALVQQG